QPVITEPEGPVPPIVILEKGTVNWPLGTAISGAGTGNFASSPTPGEDGAVRFSFAADNEHVEIFTHAHADLTRGHQAIVLRAKASQPVDMLVTLALIKNSFDYWSDLALGRPWHVADVALQTDWVDFNIPFSSMQPRGPGDPAPFGANSTANTIFALL